MDLQMLSIIALFVPVALVYLWPSRTEQRSEELS